jgi:hypothetical protein
MDQEEERKEVMKREEEMEPEEDMEREEEQERGQREFRQHLVGQRFVRTPRTAAILAEVAKSCQDPKPLEVPVEIPVEAQGPVFVKEPGRAQATTPPRAAAVAAVHERKDIALRR